MPADSTSLDLLTDEIIDAVYKVHKEMGPGLLESIYTYCLIEELKFRNLNVLKEVQVPLFYRGIQLPKDFRLDLLIENEIIMEIKSVEIINPVYAAQVISYLKLMDKRIGYVINFNVKLIKDGIRRYVNKYYDE